MTTASCAAVKPFFRFKHLIFCKNQNVCLFHLCRRCFAQKGEHGKARQLFAVWRRFFETSLCSVRFFPTSSLHDFFDWTRRLLSLCHFPGWFVCVLRDTKIDKEARDYSPPIYPSTDFLLLQCALSQPNLSCLSLSASAICPALSLSHTHTHPFCTRTGARISRTPNTSSNADLAFQNTQSKTTKNSS